VGEQIKLSGGWTGYKQESERVGLMGDYVPKSPSGYWGRGVPWILGVTRDVGNKSVLVRECV
jgi:hypothetical protein